MRGLLLLCLIGTALGFSWNGPNASPTTASKTTTKPAAAGCANDPSACGCCLMKKQMARMETYFNHTVDELSHRLNMARSALMNIQTSQVVFSVALMDEKKCLGPFYRGETVKYNTMFLNIGNGYMENTGVFTVPRSGVYSLALTVYSDSGADNKELNSCAILRVNTTDVAALRDRNSYDQEDSATLVIPRHLRVGDRVSVYLPEGCSLCDNNNHYNTFSGYLLYPSN